MFLQPEGRLDRVPLSRQNLFACGFLAVAAIVFWYLRIIGPASVDVKVHNHDLYQYFYPTMRYAAESLRAGRMPLWNPYQACGAPFLATLMPGVFYPVNLLHLFLPTHLALSYSSILQLVLGGIFMYVFARCLKLSAFAALGAGVVFMLCGDRVFNIYMTPHLASSIWIPLIFAFEEKIIETRRTHWAVLFGAALSLQFLAGWPTYSVYTAYVVTFYFMWRAVSVLRGREGVRAVGHAFGLLCLGALIAFLLSAVQLMPTLELSGQSVRPPGGLTLTQIDPPPGLRPGHVLLSGIASITGFPRREYVGIVALIAAALGLGYRDRKDVRFFFLLTAVGAFMLSLGARTPIFRLYHAFPTGDWFRNPLRFLFLYCFAVAVLSGMGLQRLTEMFRDKPDARASSRETLIWLSVVCLVTIVLLDARVLHWLATGLWASGSTLSSHPLYRPERYLPGRLYALLFLGLIWLFYLLRRGLPRRAVQAALLLLLAFDFFYAFANRSAFPEMTPEVFSEHRDLRSNLTDTSLYRSFMGTDIFDYSLPTKWGTLNGVQVVQDYEPLILKRYADFCKFLESDRPPSDLFPFRGRFLFTRTGKLQLLNLLSARHVVLGPGDTFVDDGYYPPGWETYLPEDTFKLVRDGDVKVYENAGALPRAYVASSATVIREEAEVLRYLASETFDPLNEIVLEEDPGGFLPASAQSLSGTGAVIERSLPEEVVVRADADVSGTFLVLTDTFFPGWKAYVDGKEENIYRANYLFRAVKLPQGRHVVRFVYRPRSYYVGLAISVLTVLGLTFLGISVVLRRRSG